MKRTLLITINLAKPEPPLRGLRLIHLNISCLLPKIDKSRVMAKRTKAVLTYIAESRLHITVCDSEKHIQTMKFVVAMEKNSD